MAAHIKFRKDRGLWYLVDGSLIRSLKTDKKTVAQYLRDEYIKGKYGLRPTPTVGEFYAKWIERKMEPLVRRAQARDYKQHFVAYILPAFKETRVLAIGAGDLKDFQVKLIRHGLKVKTARNIIDGSLGRFIAMRERRFAS
jgi:Phage integrase, N-terminal SAM-like domain